MNIQRLLVGTLAFVLVMGISTPAFADIVSGVEETELGPVNSQSVLGPQQVGSDIDFILTGTGTGSLGGTNFANADFTITMWANTADVIGGPSVFNVKGLAADVEIDGVGTATVTGDFGVFTNDPNDAVGFQSFVGNTPSLDYYDLFGVPNDGYDLTTNFGPVFDASPFIGQFNIPTDAGNFIVTTASDGSFEAKFKEPFVGGELLPIDSTALLLAGAQTNAVWIMSALAVIGSVAFGALYLKTRRN